MNDNKPKILIIDDEKPVRDSIGNALMHEGYNLFFAKNGKEGLSIFREINPVLMLLDINMPVMNGFEFLDEIKIKVTDPYLVAVITGYKDDQVIKNCYDKGINSFITKPFNTIELRCIVKRCIAIKQAEEEIKRQTRESEALKNALEKSKLEKQLIHSDKLSTIGAMAAGVAHEINNPLSVLSGEIYLISRDAEELIELVDKFSKLPFPPDIAKDFEKLKEDTDLPYIRENTIKKASRCKDAQDRMEKIINNLKDFSRIDNREFNNIDINSSIEKSIQIIPKNYKQNIDIQLKFTELPKIKCYGRQLEQVFLNIMVNAFHAMNNEGTLKIETTEDDHFAYAKFIDSGPGIPEDKMKEIFKPFFTTKPEGVGTGLGLSICQNIVKQHDGEIFAVNNPDKGATFSVKLLKNGR